MPLFVLAIVIWAIFGFSLCSAITHCTGIKLLSDELNEWIWQDHSGNTEPSPGPAYSATANTNEYATSPGSTLITEGSSEIFTAERNPTIPSTVSSAAPSPVDEDIRDMQAGLGEGSESMQRFITNMQSRSPSSVLETAANTSTAQVVGVSSRSSSSGLCSESPAITAAEQVTELTAAAHLLAAGSNLKMEGLDAAQDLVEIDFTGLQAVAEAGGDMAGEGVVAIDASLVARAAGCGTNNPALVSDLNLAPTLCGGASAITSLASLVSEYVAGAAVTTAAMNLSVISSLRNDTAAIAELAGDDTADMAALLDMGGYTVQSMVDFCQHDEQEEFPELLLARTTASSSSSFSLLPFPDSRRESVDAKPHNDQDVVGATVHYRRSLSAGDEKLQSPRIHPVESAAPVIDTASSSSPASTKHSWKSLLLKKFPARAIKKVMETFNKS